MFRATEPVMRGKTVIVTGANTGIGLETASELARYGARVIMACRNAERAENARNEILNRLKGQPDQAGIEQRVLVKALDLSSLKSVRAFADDILKNESKLDVLINNAGVSAYPKRTLTEDGLEMVMACNHFGHFLLTNLLLPLLKSSAPSRIVVVSSMVHRFAGIDLENVNSEKSYSSNKIYNTSKLANVYFTRHLAKQLEGTGVIVNAVHPGFVQTEIFRRSSSISQFFVGIGHVLLAKKPLQGAQTSIYLAASNDKAALVSGCYFADMKQEKVAKNAENEEKAARLWEISERLTGLKPQ